MLSTDSAHSFSAPTLPAPGGLFILLLFCFFLFSLLLVVCLPEDVELCMPISLIYTKFSGRYRNMIADSVIFIHHRMAAIKTKQRE